MTIYEFQERFTIDPPKDIEPYFKLEKKISMDTQTYKGGCLNCGDTINNELLRSMAWTEVQYCRKCKSLNVVYYSDRMGGNHTDSVFIYKEKDVQHN